jgi:predicted O-methyltransferase YrrM
MRREDCTPRVQAALAEGGRWGVEQHGDELAPFCEMLALRRLHHVLEIGFRRGGTLAVWHGLCEGLCVGVDVPDEFSTLRRQELEAAYPRMHCLLGDSHLRATYELVRTVLGFQHVDLLFIDGDHSARGVRADWEMYGRLVAPGGLVAFHDIQPNPDCQVRPLWLELQREADNSVEYNCGGPWGGIGVLEL